MFSGGGYAQYRLNETAVSNIMFNREKRQTMLFRSTTIDQLSFRFRTELDRGILFHIGEVDGSGDFSSLRLQDGGSISYHLNLGSGEERVNFPDSFPPVNDAQWHYLEVERTALDLRLRLDHFNFSHVLRGNQLNFDVYYSKFYAGGAPGQGDAQQSFIGCLEDIRVDQNILPTTGSNRFATISIAVSSNVSIGCGLRGCFPHPCQYGNCTEIDDSRFRCSCSDGTVQLSRPCPNPKQVTRYLLVIIVGSIVGSLLLVLVIAIVSKLTLL